MRIPDMRKKLIEAARKEMGKDLSALLNNHAHDTALVLRRIENKDKVLGWYEQGIVADTSILDHYNMVFGNERQLLKTEALTKEMAGDELGTELFMRFLQKNLSDAVLETLRTRPTAFVAQREREFFNYLITHAHGSKQGPYSPQEAQQFVQLGRFVARGCEKPDFWGSNPEDACAHLVQDLQREYQKVRKLEKEWPSESLMESCRKFDERKSIFLSTLDKTPQQKLLAKVVSGFSRAEAGSFMDYWPLLEDHASYYCSRPKELKDTLTELSHACKEYPEIVKEYFAKKPADVRSGRAQLIEQAQALTAEVETVVECLGEKFKTQDAVDFIYALPLPVIEEQLQAPQMLSAYMQMTIPLLQKMPTQDQRNIRYAIDLADGDMIRFQKIVNDTLALQQTGADVHLSDWTKQSYATYNDLTLAGRSVDFDLFASNDWSTAIAKTVQGAYQPVVKFLSKAIDKRGSALASQLQLIQDPKAKELVVKAENRSAYEALRRTAYQNGEMDAQALYWALQNNSICSTAAKLGADPKVQPGIVLDEISEHYITHRIGKLQEKYQKACPQSGTQ